MKNGGDVIIIHDIIEKVLRTLIPQFDHIVIEIEDSKNLASMLSSEMHDSLEYVKG